MLPDKESKCKLYFRSLAPPHCLGEGHVVHQFDPGDLGDVSQPHHWLSQGQFALPT